jgi:hypothetical protein
MDDVFAKLIQKNTTAVKFKKIPAYKRSREQCIIFLTIIESFWKVSSVQFEYFCNIIAL